MISKDSPVRHIIKKRNKNSKINNSILEISKRKQQKKNIITILYLNKDNKSSKPIKLFGEKFITNNRNKYKIFINNKIIKNGLIKSEEELIKIKLRFYDDPIKLDFMLEGCINLIDVSGIEKLKTHKVKSMSHLFYECESLESLPDISKWDISKVKDISYLFSGCIELNSLPDISNWKTNNVVKMRCLFANCPKLETLPDISNWDISKAKDIGALFLECKSLKSLPEISKWNTNNVNILSFIFFGCSSLKKFLIFQNGNLKN